jgi:hypothetical protein
MSPFTQHFLIASATFLMMAGIGYGGFYLHAAFQREIRAIRYFLTLKDGEVESLSSRLSEELKDLSERVLMAEDRAGVLAPPVPPPSGFNLARRSQAVRMLNRGAEPGVVAAALSLPRPEVLLLARVRRLAGPVSVPIGDREAL